MKKGNAPQQEKDDLNATIAQIKLSTYLNLCACHQKLGVVSAAENDIDETRRHAEEGLKAAEEALKLEPGNTKALYRRGQVSAPKFGTRASDAPTRLRTHHATPPHRGAPIASNYLFVLSRRTGSRRPRAPTLLRAPRARSTPNWSTTRRFTPIRSTTRRSTPIRSAFNDVTLHVRCRRRLGSARSRRHGPT